MMDNEKMGKMILSYLFKCLDQECLFSIEFGAGNELK